MNLTFAYILYCQSPALFLAAAALLLCFICRVRRHPVRAWVDLVLAVLAAVGGVMLYYFGMFYEHFTIHNFWQLRAPGWVGLVLMALLILFLLYRGMMHSLARRRAARQAEKAEKSRLKELEDAKSTAYASGKADAQAAAVSQEHTSEQGESDKA